MPEARVEPMSEAYEPPSVTELGSFLGLTAGGAGVPGGDAVGSSQAN